MKHYTASNKIAFPVSWARCSCGKGYRGSYRWVCKKMREHFDNPDK